MQLTALTMTQSIRSGWCRPGLAQVPPDATEHLQLKMATRLLDSAVLTEKGVPSFSTTRAYVEVLCQQELYEEAVKFICSPRGGRLGLLEGRLEILCQTLVLQKRYRAANAAAKMLWKINSDNWAPFQTYLDTIEKVSEDAEDASTVITLESDEELLRASIPLATADSSWDAALALADELQALENQERAKKRRRGPFMAKLAILHKKGDTQALSEAIVQYTKLFVNKPCCFLDISTFLTSQSAEAVYQWSTAGEEEDSLAQHNKRILGLRTYISQWGCEAGAIPEEGELKRLIQVCKEGYEAARPLSTSLAWSEEGLCDGYIHALLNIVLHAYVAHGKDATWLSIGLEAFDHVDRRMNNPAWLIFSSCFAHLLRLADRAAVRQLAFKDIQHDTMFHLSYWPLRKGLAMDDIVTFVKHASIYYGRMERDVSLLRAKVFTFMSWPAMQDIKRFEYKQMHSLAKVLHTPERVLALLPECQTQKNILKLLDTYGAQLWTSLTTLRDARAPLVDNSDWSVCRSMVLANIHTEKAARLSEALVHFAPKEERVQWGVQLNSSLLLLHDVVAIEVHLARLALLKKQSSKKSKNAPQAPAVEALILYSEKSIGELGGVECFPRIQPIATVLQPYIKSEGEETVVDTQQTFEAALKTVTQSPEVFEEFLFNEMFILVALLQVGSVAKTPVVAWANMLQETLVAAKQKYESGEWSFSAVPVTGDLGNTLLTDKSNQTLNLISELTSSVTAVTRRR
ncbi:hypothetical protein AGDE_01818 [Angomonas deanei]|uniref:N-acetyltransferase B complex (NatB) non catalytic subunit, putative n=1 Tax=Angomonas deanei TaxID=59799 RepID=A0A7G2CFX3_9TRYP|nr:hypothetical protein AGDE_01818 [Angomonas deanei]CAD2218255.1 N-acetyltransferase B complex (NatB) non catalytic subunit, putative [Angomonas deanei]|eukprot:EPY42105.1 hypothetical protein AGDE_01818 [Angomonas deanei]